MSNRNDAQFSKMYEVLEQNHFEFGSNISDDFKCIICRNILINACQSRCGCRFCRKCADRMIENGSESCPGNTEDCKEESLSHLQLDYRINRQISKLRMLCPVEMCFHECELINMGEHLRLCSQQDEKCPFYDFGCGNDKLHGNEMNEHLFADLYNHNKMLLDMLGNLKNDMAGMRLDMGKLKEKEVSNENSIDLLRETLREKEQEITMLKKEMDTIKVENKNRRLEIQKLNTNIDNAARNSVKIFERAEPVQICRESLLGNSSSIGRTPRAPPTKHGNCQLIWKIENMSEKKEKNEWVNSSFFITPMKYKMKLLLWTNGYGPLIGTSISIFLMVFPPDRGTNCKWPFKGDVTVKIVNDEVANVSKSTLKYCVIEKPETVSGVCHWATPFNFIYDDLVTEGLLRNDCFYVDCIVNER